MYTIEHFISRNLTYRAAILVLAVVFTRPAVAEEVVPESSIAEERTVVNAEAVDVADRAVGKNEVAAIFTPSVEGVLALALGERGSLLNQVLDVNQDGVIDAAEVANSKRSILKLDQDSDGIISSLELGATVGYEALLRVHRLQQALDLDGDNQLSSLEVLEAEKNLKQLDVNADWKLSSDELISPITQENVSSWDWLLGQSTQLDNESNQKSVDTTGWYLAHLADSNLGLELGLNSVLLDAAGEVIHQWRHTQPAATGSRAELLSNGLLLRSSSVNDRKPFSSLDTQHGLLELVDWNGNVVWKYQRCDESNYCLYGPVKSLPNGNILITSYLNTAEFNATETISLNESKRTAGIYEIKPNYDDGSTDLVWSWSGNIVNQQIPDALAGLSFDAEINQIAFTTYDHQQVVVIERGVNESNAALHTITVNDLVSEGEATDQLQIIDAQWLEDISGQADIALLLKHDDGYAISELSLPINKNGTYVQSVKPVIVKQLDLLGQQQAFDFHGLTPLENGGFLLVDKNSNSIVSVNQDGGLSRVPGKINARVTSVELYQQDYAAFNDKGLAPTITAVTPEYEKPVIEEQATVLEQVVVSDQDELLTGVWSMLIDTPMGEEASELTLVQKGELIAGNLDGDPLKVEVTDNTIEMTLERVSPAGIVTIIYNGIIDEAVISGNYIFDSGPTTGTTRSWSASR